MKKLFFLVFVFYSITSSAQVWCLPGAQWHYDYGFFAATGYVNLRYISDTVYEGKNCHKLTEHLHTVDQSNWNVYDAYTDYFSYDSGGIVFAFDYYNSIWDTLFNFNAVPGNRWHLFLGNSNAYVEVIDTGTNSVQGYDLKWLTINYSPNLLGNFADTIYERIGCVGFNYPFISSVLSTDPGIMVFCNYSDSVFTDYVYPDTYCQYMPDGIDELNEIHKVNVYPNPSTGKLGMKFENEIPLSFEILDITGRICKTEILLENEVISNLEALNPGFYFLRFQFKDKNVVERIEIIK